LTGVSPVGRAGHGRHADGGIHGVVDGRRAVGPAHHPRGDEVGAVRAQALVRQEAFGRKVGDEQAGILAGCADQLRHEFAAFGAGEVDGDRQLALVQALPVQAGPVVARGARPAVEVGAAADGIDADHLGAHLQQVQGARRRGDEGGALDDAQALQQGVHGGDQATRSNTAASPWPPPMHMVSRA
jgi:hypothetical protein